MSAGMGPDMPAAMWQKGHRIMPKQSIFYPQTPTPLANIDKHPRFVVLLNLRPSDREAQLGHAMRELWDNCDKYGAGMTLHELLVSQPAREPAVMMALAEELVRMRVFVLDNTGTEPRLIPASMAAAAEGERQKRKPTTINIPVHLLDRLKRLSDERYQSITAIVVLAIADYLGEDREAA
jgi:hypothetical protein